MGRTPLARPAFWRLEREPVNEPPAPRVYTPDSVPALLELWRRDQHLFLAVLVSDAEVVVALAELDPADDDVTIRLTDVKRRERVGAGNPIPAEIRLTPPDILAAVDMVTFDAPIAQTIGQNFDAMLQITTTRDSALPSVALYRRSRFKQSS